MKKITVRVLWGSDEIPQSYSFNTQAEVDAFLFGVDESNGWLSYEVEEDIEVSNENS
jgi:hypothetical protein